MNDCPMEPWIPKCMVVGGGASLALIAVVLFLLVCGAMDNKGAVFVATVLLYLHCFCSHGKLLVVTGCSKNGVDGVKLKMTSPGVVIKKTTYSSTQYWSFTGWLVHAKVAVARCQEVISFCLYYFCFCLYL